MTRSLNDPAFAAVQRAMKREIRRSRRFRWGVAGWLAVAVVPVLLAAAGLLVVLS